jgi:hypothetical protein
MRLSCGLQSLDPYLALSIAMERVPEGRVRFSQSVLTLQNRCCTTRQRPSPFPNGPYGPAGV